MESSLIFSKFTSRLPDEHSQVGSRMRSTWSTCSRTVRKLIPEAVNPVLKSYWDYDAVWTRAVNP